jgi:hypothetical protein
MGLWEQYVHASASELRDFHEVGMYITPRETVLPLYYLIFTTIRNQLLLHTAKPPFKVFWG